MIEENKKHLTVSELTQEIRGQLEPTFKSIWVQGEVSNFRPAASGHLYFSLKDSQASISAAVFGWGSRGKKNEFQFREGLQVLCHGKLSVYPPRGSYQIVIDQVFPLGAGALQLAFEKLKEKLHQEGLFDLKRKRPLPRFPEKIAVVTSPTGAAIQDMLNVLKRRAPQIEVLVVPALVQGDQAPSQMIKGIEVINRYHLAEVIVLARGGGSIEDLWCFNDEQLARVIFQSELPILSAVGHEIDFTISDFVADVRAPTPSAAAEVVSLNWGGVLQQVQALSERAQYSLRKNMTMKGEVLMQLSKRVINPKDRIQEQIQRVDDYFTRLERAVLNDLRTKKLALGQVLGKIDALSPLKVLERGYSMVRSDGGEVVRSIKQVKKDDRLGVIFHDGKIQVRVLG